MGALSMEREIILREWVLSAAMASRPDAAPLRSYEVAATCEELKAVVEYLEGKGLIEREGQAMIFARGLDYSRMPDFWVKITPHGVDRVYAGEEVNSDSLLADMSTEEIEQLEQAVIQGGGEPGILQSAKQGLGSSLGGVLITTFPKMFYRFSTSLIQGKSVPEAIVSMAIDPVE